MPIFSFDTRTVVVILMGVTIILGVTMILIRLTRKTYPGFGLWTAGITAFALAFLLLALRNIIPDIFSIVLYGVMEVFASLCFLEGTRLFRGKDIRKLFIVLILIAFTIFQSYFTFVNNDINLRIIVISLLIAAMFGSIAFELLRNLPPGLRFSYWFTGSLFTLYSIFMFARALFTGFFLSPQDILDPSILHSLTFLLAIFLGVGWTIGFIMLNSERLEDDLKRAQAELQKMATSDFLTGIANNRSFLETSQREIQRTHRYQRPLAVLMIDLDHFKKVNDTYGHAIGDKILVGFADICKKSLRDADIFGRLGGEEFAILLPETDINGGKIMAEHLLATIAKTAIEIENKTLHITVSIGVTELLPDEDQLDSVLKRADDAMYEAKRKGRNKVITTSS